MTNKKIYSFNANGGGCRVSGRICAKHIADASDQVLKRIKDYGRMKVNVRELRNQAKAMKMWLEQEKVIKTMKVWLEQEKVIGDRFYLACFRDNVGSSVGWHCIDGCGYSTNIDKAHVYTLKEAQEELNQAREIDMPISADHVDALAVWKVDHQYIPNESQVIDGISQYVAFERGGREGRYDGNDVYWLNTELCSTSTDFDKASVMGASRAQALDPCYIVVPFETANKFKRRTFDKNLFNPLVMLQGAGLTIPKHLKKLHLSVKKLHVELENSAGPVGAKP